MVMNTILGGSFTSRLNSNLREDKGYTYGATSGFSMRREPGPFVARAAVNTPVTDSAVVEFLRELRRLVEEPVGDVELDRARKYLTLRLPQRFETVGSVAAQIADQVLNNLADDYYETYVERVIEVTAEDVRRVAVEYLDPDEMVVVIAGDRAAIQEGLEGLGVGFRDFTYRSDGDGRRTLVLTARGATTLYAVDTCRALHAGQRPPCQPLSRSLHARGGREPLVRRRVAE